MPKDKPRNPEGLRSLPKPIQLDLPKGRQKSQRRLHDTDTDLGKYEFVQKPKQEPPKQRNSHGKGYFNSAQRTYGQRRPRQPKPIKPPPKRTSKAKTTNRPRLGAGDRLYTPYIPREPFIPPKVKRVLKFWALGLIVIAFVVMGILSRFGSNAWAVYLDGALIGHMPINREVEPETIHENAVRHLADSIGAEIHVNETAVVQPVRTRRGELLTPQQMNLLISHSFTFQIVASAIYIDGQRVAIMRNIEDAEHVARELQRQYINDNTIEDLVSFEEEWQLVRVMIDEQELDDPRDVIQYLERPTRQVFPHTIRRGDTQGGLSAEFNIPLDRIGYLNDISPDAIIREGEIIYLETIRPRLSVRTVDEIFTIEEIEKDIETIENPDKHVSVGPTIIQDGRNGERRVTKRVTRINGNQVGEPEIVSSQTLRAAVTRIVEIGTSETLIEVR